MRELVGYSVTKPTTVRKSRNPLLRRGRKQSRHVSFARRWRSVIVCTVHLANVIIHLVVQRHELIVYLTIHLAIVIIHLAIQRGLIIYLTVHLANVTIHLAVQRGVYFVHTNRIFSVR